MRHPKNDGNSTDQMRKLHARKRVESTRLNHWKKNTKGPEGKNPEAARTVLIINTMSLHIAIKLTLSVTTSNVDASKATRVKEVPVRARVKLSEQERLS